MMMPSIFGESLLDDFFGFRDPFREYPVVDKNSLMKTDVKESETGYQLEISLPGYQKENIHAELENGYLTVHATTSRQKDEKDDTTGKYIRRERFSGSCSRSFYVGEDITEEDIKAKYENGVLMLAIPKKEVKKIEESKKMIAIEG